MIHIVSMGQRELVTYCGLVIEDDSLMIATLPEYDENWRSIPDGGCDDCTEELLPVDLPIRLTIRLRG